MTDFYSVLKTSIIKRNLRSSAERREVYGQAREAMIRRLWTLDPPLSEDEIDARIGLFDAAVERIEADLELAFAAKEGPARLRQPARSAPRPRVQPFRPPPVYEGYDEDADYVPAATEPPPGRRDDMRAPPPAHLDGTGYEAQLRRRQDARHEFHFGRRPERAHHERPATAPRRELLDGSSDLRRKSGLVESRPGAYQKGAAANDPTALQRVDYHDDAYHEPAHDDGIIDEPLDRDDHHYQLPAVVDVAYDEDGYDDDGYGETSYGDGRFRQPTLDDPAYYERDDRGERYHAPPTRPAREARRRPDDFRQSDGHAADFEPRGGRHPPAEHRSSKRGPGKNGRRPSRRAGGRSVPILAISIGVLAVILIAFNAYVFLPIIFGAESSRSATVTPPTKVEDRLPALGPASTAAARIVSDSATAAEIPERNLNVAESLIIFNGSDPTVFEGSSNNPIQFDNDSEGGFARISSAASAAGARAVIGPGLADRLAGRTVRVTVLARSSDENGARTMRFAYQSGLAVSHWQSADLSRNYGTYGMIWRVPAADNAAGDYLLIEPGIPGDGTSTDIRMIKIDILTS